MVEWNDSLLIGVEAIDRQHKSLFEKLKLIELAIAAGNGDTVATDIIAFMDKYVVEHFGQEEALMEEIGYPDVAEHKQEHQLFIDKSIEFELDKHIGDVALPKNMLAFFAEWFVQHVSMSDNRIGTYIKEKH